MKRILEVAGGAVAFAMIAMIAIGIYASFRTPVERDMLYVLSPDEIATLGSSGSFE